MQIARKIWSSVKRNPVINAAIVAIIGQAITQAIENGHYDVKTIATYALQLSLAYVAREFTVPVKEHENALNEIGVVSVRERDNAVDTAYRAGMIEGGEKS